MSKSKQPEISEYSPNEERLNILSHGLGIVLALIGTFLLVSKAAYFGEGVHVVSFAIYGVSMVVLYSASTLYHCAKEPLLRRRLKIFDHAVIYVFIAGSYTPFTLVVLNDWVGWTLFGVVWSMALSGIVLKLFFTGRFKILSSSIYVLMGWLIVLAIEPLSNSLPAEGLFWLVAGGISYTIGAVLYSIKSMPFNHAIFHVFVLLGTIFQFLTVYQYILVAS